MLLSGAPTAKVELEFVSVFVSVSVISSNEFVISLFSSSKRIPEKQKINYLYDFVLIKSSKSQFVLPSILPKTNKSCLILP